MFGFRGKLVLNVVKCINNCNIVKKCSIIILETYIDM